MPRYAITTTFADPNPLRAPQLDAEYDAIEDATNNVVDIDAAQTQFDPVSVGAGDFPSRKLARRRFVVPYLFDNAGAVTAAAPPSPTALIQLKSFRQCGSDGQILGLSVAAFGVPGSVSPMSGVLGASTITYTLRNSGNRVPSSLVIDTFDEAPALVSIAGFEHTDFVGMAHGEAAMLSVAASVARGDFLSLWVEVAYSGAFTFTSDLMATLWVAEEFV